MAGIFGSFQLMFSPVASGPFDFCWTIPFGGAATFCSKSAKPKYLLRWLGAKGFLRLLGGRSSRKQAIPLLRQSN